MILLEGVLWTRPVVVFLAILWTVFAIVMLLQIKDWFK